MVSSRCVAGLSTGMRPVSASSTMNSAANASTCAGLSSFQVGALRGSATIWLRSVEPAVMATVKIASISAGSAMAAMVISRLLPMPPNALAGSSPPSARKNRPRASSPTSASTPPNRLNGAGARDHRHHQAGQQRA